jgi:hypothetical protein
MVVHHHGYHLFQDRDKATTVKSLHQKVAIHNGRAILHNAGATD